jgi:anti-sigma factor RsiW
MERNQECERVRAQISAFLDNQIGSQEAILMTHHLETCVPCRHEYEQIKAVRTALHSLTPPTAAMSEAAKVHAFARLEQTLAQDKAPKPDSVSVFWRSLLSGVSLRPLVASMAVAVVAGTTFLLWPSDDITPTVSNGSVSAPTTAEWDNLFHRHDAQSIAFSTDDPALRRDAAAEAHASLLRQADDELTDSL